MVRPENIRTISVMIKVRGNSDGRSKSFWCSTRWQEMGIGAKDHSRILVAGSDRNVSQDSGVLSNKSGKCGIEEIYLYINSERVVWYAATISKDHLEH